MDKKPKSNKKRKTSSEEDKPSRRRDDGEEKGGEETPGTESKLFKKLDEFQNNFIERLDSLEKKFDKKFDKQEKKFDKKFDKLENKFDKKFDNLENKFDERFDSLEESVNLLVSLSPEAVMHRINPAIVTSQEMIYSAVLEGGESTWSFLQEKDGTVFAVGSVHCGLYYGSTHPTLSFVSLPQKVVDLGVEKIGFLEPNNIKNPIPYKNDAMLVQLKKKNLQEKGLVKQYKVISPKKRFSRVAGMSNSGIVSGKNAIFNADDGHYVFVEDFGEAGNSGTLLFGWDGDSNNAKPVGVYFGMFPVGGSSGNNSFRPRGVVAPLPDPKECTWFQPLVTNFPMSFVVTDQKGYKKCTISQGSTGAAACFLKDDGVEWPGVLLKFPSETDKFWYCGSVDMGSRRSK